MANHRLPESTLPDPLNAALVDALQWARREGRPVSVWAHLDRFSLRVQPGDCHDPDWILIATIQPDDKTGEVLVGQ